MGIDPTAFVHASAIVDEGAVVNADCKIWHFVHVCNDAKIGEKVSLGQNVYVGNRVLIGDRCKIQNNVSVYDNVFIEDDVFCERCIRSNSAPCRCAPYGVKAFGVGSLVGARKGGLGLDARGA